MPSDQYPTSHPRPTTERGPTAKRDAERDPTTERAAERGPTTERAAERDPTTERDPAAEQAARAAQGGRTEPHASAGERGGGGQNPIIAEVAADLPAAETAVAACQATVTALGRHAPVTISVLLRVHDRLRCVAATGSWQIFATVAPELGVVGRVYSSGKTELVADVSRDPDYLPLRPDVAAELCTPLLDRAGRPMGVLDLQWTGQPDLESWRGVAEGVAALLAARISQLGGPPAESRSEKLLRHAAALTTATSESELLTAALAAARDVTGHTAAVLAVPELHDGARLAAPTGVPGTLEVRIRAGLAAAGPAALRRLIAQAHRYGAAYTLGEEQPPATADHAMLAAAGVGTLIAVPIGPAGTGGVLLVADERRLRPDPTTVNLVELLAAQSWICLERLRGLAALRQRASSDPLTGLRHHGSFGERIALATPGRTALLAIDVDNFKSVNDTYGHQVGDQILVDLARALERALRQGDELYRIGGDEFVAVVEVSRADEALGIGERLAAAARGTGRTVSVGVALQRDGEPPDVTLRRADSALYVVKRAGRNGVRLATT